jgi:two-component system sensor histidine kinase UhpB
MLGRRRLVQRVFLLNAAIFVLGTLALVISPATISFPVELTEAIVIGVGLTSLLVLNGLALRAAFRPLERLTQLIRTIDPERPGVRVELDGTSEVEELAQAFNQMLDRLEGERRDSARRALAAQERERKRVAQELHDEVGQALTAVLLQLELLGQHSPAIADELRRVQNMARDALDSVASVVRQLRPEALDLGLRNALVALANRVEEQTGLGVELHLDNDVPDLGDEHDLAIYRITQESLTNVARHADATRATVTLSKDDAMVTLHVLDNGSGRPAGARDGAGIQGMRERARLAGGNVTIGTASSGGTEVVLRVPL